MIEMKRSDVKERETSGLPWFVDIFLYPASKGGAAMLGLFVVLPFVLALAYMAVVHVLGVGAIPIGFLLGLINWVLYFYMFWYLGFCIRESAEGNFRAPDNMAPDFDDSLGETVGQTLLILGTAAVCLLPAILYSILRSVDGTFWMIMADGGFFLPMAMLSAVMQNGYWGLNPFRILLSILRTHVHYLLIVPVFYAPIGIIACFVIYFVRDDNAFVYMLFRSAYVYLLIVAAHVLGRFFFRNEERLDWF